MARATQANSADRACPLGICDGSGWILGPEDVARPCKCREGRLHRSRSRGVASLIPARYRGVSFDRPPVSDMARDLQTRHVVDAVKAYVEELPSRVAEGRGIWLMGGTGTGKTTLTMLVAKAAGERGFAVGVYFAPKLLARIRQTYQAESNEDSYLEFFERLASVDLLVVDDLGAERKTDWVIEQLYAVVNERYERQLPIAITSNADGAAVDAAIEQLKAEIGARTVSRLVEICGDPLPLFGEDRRYGLGLAS